MKTDPDDIPEPDRVPGALHPRHTPRVIGQDHAIAEFVQAAHSDRLHHAWLLTGPRGVGKATMAWAIARWLLLGAESPDMRTDPDTPEARRVSALSEPRLQLIRRPWDEKTKKHKSGIPVEEVRKVGGFFSTHASHGGWRIVIVDAADDLKISQNMIDQITNLDAFDVIPLNNTLYLIGSDGLYQYDYTDPKDLKFISKLEMFTSEL